MPPRRHPRNSHLLQYVQIGDEIEVWWPDDNTYYPGRVDRAIPGNRHRIVYNDGEVEVLRLDAERWRFQGEAAERVQALTNNRTHPMEASSSDPRPQTESLIYPVGQSAASGSRRASGPPSTITAPKKVKGRLRRALSPAPAAVSSTSSPRRRSRTTSSPVETRREKDTASSQTISKRSEPSPSSPKTKSSSTSSSHSNPKVGFQSDKNPKPPSDKPAQSAGLDNREENTERQPSVSANAAASPSSLPKYGTLPSASTHTTPADATTTQAATTKALPTQAAPAKAAPAQAAPAQAAPRQAAPAKSTPAKSTPVKSAPAKSAPAKSAPAKSAPAKSAPAKSAPAKVAPAKVAPTQAAPTQAAPTQAAPTQTKPTKDLPIKDVPSQAAPTRAASTQAALTQAAPTKVEPPKVEPPKVAPTKVTSAKGALTQAVSTQAKSTQAAPAQAVLTQAAPTKTAPSSAVSTRVASAQTVSTEAKPTQVKLSQAKSTRVEPTQAVPAQAVTSGAEPTRAAPTQAVPSEISRTQAVSVQDTLTQTATTQATIAQTTSAPVVHIRASPAGTAIAHAAPTQATPARTALAPTTTKLAAPGQDVLTQATLPRVEPPQVTRTKTILSQTTPAQATPTQATPTQATPTQAIPTQAIPTQATSAQATPTQATPTQATPTQATPTQATPTQTTPTQTTPTQTTLTQTAPTQAATRGKSSPAKRLLVKQPALVDTYISPPDNARISADFDKNVSARHISEPQAAVDNLQTTGPPSAVDMRKERIPFQSVDLKSKVTPELQAALLYSEGRPGPQFDDNPALKGPFVGKRSQSGKEYDNISPSLTSGLRVSATNQQLLDMPSRHAETSKNPAHNEIISHSQMVFQANDSGVPIEHTKTSAGCELSDSLKQRTNLAFQKAMAAAAADPGKSADAQPLSSMRQESSASSGSHIALPQFNSSNSHMVSKSTVSLPLEGSTNSNDEPNRTFIDSGTMKQTGLQSTASGPRSAPQLQQSAPVLPSRQDLDGQQAIGPIQQSQYPFARSGMQSLETLADASLADRYGSTTMAISSLLMAPQGIAEGLNTEAKSRTTANPLGTTGSSAEKKSSVNVNKTTLPQQREFVNITPNAPVASGPESAPIHMVPKPPPKHETHTPSNFAANPNIDATTQQPTSDLSPMRYETVHSKTMPSRSVPQTFQNNMVNASRSLENPATQVDSMPHAETGLRRAPISPHTVGLTASSPDSFRIPFQPRSRTHARATYKSTALPIGERLQNTDSNNIVFTVGTNSFRAADQTKRSFVPTGPCQEDLNMTVEELRNRANPNYTASLTSPRVQGSKHPSQPVEPHTSISAPLSTEGGAMRGSASSSHFTPTSPAGLSNFDRSKGANHHAVSGTTVEHFLPAKDDQFFVDMRDYPVTIGGSNPGMRPSNEPLRETTEIASHGTAMQVTPTLSNSFRTSAAFGALIHMNNNSSCGMPLLPNSGSVRTGGQAIPNQKSLEERALTTPSGVYSVKPSSTSLQRHPATNQQTNEGVTGMSFSSDDIPLASGQRFRTAQNSVMPSRSFGHHNNISANMNSTQKQHLVHSQSEKNRGNPGKSISVPKAAWHTTRISPVMAAVSKASNIHGQVPPQANVAHLSRSPNSAKAVPSMKLSVSRPPDLESNSVGQGKKIPLSASSPQLNPSQPPKAMHSACRPNDIIRYDPGSTKIAEAAPGGHLPRIVIASMASGPLNARRPAVDPRIKSNDNADVGTSEKVSHASHSTPITGEAKRRFDNRSDSATKRRRLESPIGVDKKTAERETRKAQSSPLGPNTVPYEKTVEGKGNIIGIQPKSATSEGVLKRPRGHSFGDVRGKPSNVSRPIPRTSPTHNADEEIARFNVQRSGALGVVERNKGLVPVQIPPDKVNPAMSRGRSNPNVTQNVEKGTASLPLNILMKTITDSNEQVLNLKMEPLTRKLDSYFSTNQIRTNIMLQKLESLVASSEHYATPEGIRLELSLPKQQLNDLLKNQQYLREILSCLTTRDNTEQVRINGLTEVESRVDKLESQMNDQFKILNARVDGLMQNTTSFKDFTKSFPQEIEQWKSMLGLHSSNLQKEMEQQRSIVQTELLKLEGIEERMMEKVKSSMRTIFKEMQKESAVTVARAIQQTFQVQEDIGNISTLEVNCNADAGDPSRRSNEPSDNIVQDNHSNAEENGEQSQYANTNNAENDAGARDKKSSKYDIAVDPNEADSSTGETQFHVSFVSKDLHHEGNVNEKQDGNNGRRGTDFNEKGDSFLATTAATVAAAVAAAVASNDLADGNVDDDVKFQSDNTENNMDGERNEENIVMTKQVRLNGQSDEMLEDKIESVSSAKGPQEVKPDGQIDKDKSVEPDIDGITKEQRESNVLLDGVVRRDTRELLGRVVITWLLCNGCRSHPPGSRRARKALVSEWSKDAAQRCLKDVLTVLLKHKKVEDARVSLDRELDLQTNTLQLDWIMKGPTLVNISEARCNYSQWEPPLQDYEWDLDRAVLTKVAVGLLQAEKKVLESWLGKSLNVLEIAKDVVRVGLSNFPGTSM